MENIIVAVLMVLIAGKFAIPTAGALLSYSLFDYFVFEQWLIFGSYELEAHKRDLYYSSASLIAAIASAICLFQAMKPPHCRYALVLSLTFIVTSISTISLVFGVSETNSINVLVYNNMITVQFLIVCAKGLGWRTYYAR